MAVVLKIAAQGNVHRVRLEEAPTFNSLDALLQDLYPNAGDSGGCCMARYTDEDGDACLLTRFTFGDFLETARTTGGGICPVLRLEILPSSTYASVVLNQARGAGIAAAEETPCRLFAAGCLPQAGDDNFAASPEAAWLSIEPAHDSNSSDGSWVCAGSNAGDGSGESSARGPPIPEPESRRAESPHAGRNQGTLDESGLSELNFNSLAFSITELHADDWNSSAGTCAEQEVVREAPHTRDTSLSPETTGLQAVPSAEKEASQEVLLSLLQPDVTSSEAPACTFAEAAAAAESVMPMPTGAAAILSPPSPVPAMMLDSVEMLTSTPSQGCAPAGTAQKSVLLAFEPAPEPALSVEPVPAPPSVATEVPKATSAIEPVDGTAVENGNGAKCQVQCIESTELDLEAGLGRAALLPCTGSALPHASEEEPQPAANRPVSPAIGRRQRAKGKAKARQPQRAKEVVGVEGKVAAKGQQCPPVTAAWQGGKLVWLEASLEQTVHMGHICDGCEACPLPGPRFTCRTCGDYDLCWTCHMRRDQLPQPHDPSHRFQQVLWSEEVVPTCPGGCGFGVTPLSNHSTHCCSRCADAPGTHTDACQAANAHDDDGLEK